MATTDETNEAGPPPLPPNDEEQEKTEEPQVTTTPQHGSFKPGDHVYKWCSFAGIPGMFQHHGIVLDVEEDCITVVDFSAMIRPGGEKGHSQKTLLFSPRGNIRESKQESPKDWHNVQYGASLWKRTLYRSGTCTASPSDPPGLVLARTHFLLNHSDTLPNYSITKANCECVAVWCKTGVWATLQASSFLQTTAAGQVKSATTLALLASSTQVTVPSSGMWGMLGFTTKVSLATANPMLLPAIAGYGLLTVGGPIWTLTRARQFWHQTTTRLNEEFWESAIERPDVFVECITEWSELS